MCILFWHLFFITFVTNSQHLAEKWQQKRKSVKRTPKGEARRTSMKVTAWFKNAFVRLKSDRRKAGKEEHSTLLIGSRRCGAFKRKFNFIWHWLLSFRPISDGCCCRSGLVLGPLVGPRFGFGNYFVDLPQSRFACNISSSFPAKNELLASEQATCSHVAPFASRLQCETKEEWLKKGKKVERWEYWCFWHAFVHNFAITINKCEDWARKN